MVVKSINGSSAATEWCDHKLSCAVIYNALKMGHTTDSVIKGKDDVIPGCEKEKAIEKNQDLYARVMSE